jgi:hypothetical protein
MRDRNSKRSSLTDRISLWVAMGFLLILVCIIAIVTGTIFSATGSLFSKYLQCGDGGCPPTPIVVTPTPDPRLFETVDIGTELTYNGKKLLVTGVTQATSYGKVTSDDGYQLVAVNISFTDLTDTQLDMSTSNFDVIDNAGHTYTRVKDAKTPALSSQPASSPPSATGWLTFQVPAKASNLILQYPVTNRNGNITVLQVRLGDLVGHSTVIPTVPGQ